MREREMDQAALAGLAGRPSVGSAKWMTPRLHENKNTADVLQKHMIIGGEVGGPRGPIQVVCRFMEQIGTGGCA